MRFPEVTSILRFMLCLLAALPASTGIAHAAGDWWAISHRLAPASTSVDFTPHGTQPGLFNQLVSSENCAGCHRGNSATAQVAYRPYSSWAGSMMANATRDPLFWAALDVANNDAPGSGDYCLRCHTPRGWLGGHVVKAGFGAPDNDVAQGTAGCLLGGAYDAADDLDNDYSGENCHFCHRLMPQGPQGQAPYTGNANAWVDDANCQNTGDFEPCRRGPYNYALGDDTPPHAWVQSNYHTQGAICGLCHNVTSPDVGVVHASDSIFVDGFEKNPPLKTLRLNDGTDTMLPFPIERTFSEWQQSQYAQPTGQTCQACHMPESEDPNASACSLPGYPNRSGNLPVHAFVGGNTWVTGIIKGQYAQGIFNNGGNDRSASFDQTIAWTRQLLGNAASVATTIQGYTPPGGSAGSMTVAVKVTNLSGHKLPTGYAEGRRMWVNLQVRDANGALVFESGAYDAASGVLNIDTQARVYEIQQGIFNHLGTSACDIENGSGNAMFHFVLNDCIAKDNRIPPLGFRPVTAGDPNGYELRPVGATYPETTPGSGILVNYDTANYMLSVPVGTVGPLTATARLYYQTSSKDYIEFLRDEALANATPAENMMCAGASNRPFSVGPQGRTRGEYAYELWNNAPSDITQPGYGKSPPELMQTASGTTSR